MKSIKSIVKHLLRMDENSIDALRSRGVRIGKGCSINTNYIDYGHGFLITIGDNVTIAVNAIILAHDASTKPFLGYSKVGRVNIGSNVFIGGGSIILPGISIGNNVIIGAGCVVTHSIPDNSVVVGNPGRVIGTTTEYLEKNKQMMKTAPKYDTYWMDKTSEDKEKMRADLQSEIIGFDI